jgi:FdhD protein
VTTRPLYGRARRHTADRHTSGWSVQSEEWLVVEQPLAINVNGEVIATTMCTPDDPAALGLGFCIAEGMLQPEVVAGVSVDRSGPTTTVVIETGHLPGSFPARLGTVSSSCGACGTADMAAMVSGVASVHAGRQPDENVVSAVASNLRSQQEVFALTGGSHAAAAVTVDGQVIDISEDVGRHNAVDKVVGHLYSAGRLPAKDLMLVISGRASFEMVQKACAAGFGTLIAVSAPSSLAVDAAQRAGLRLIGFARDDRFTAYVDPTSTSRQ